MVTYIKIIETGNQPTARKNKMLLVESINNKFLIDVAAANPGGTSPEMEAIVAKLEAAGPWADATEDAIEAFDTVLDALNAA